MTDTYDEGSEPHEHAEQDEGLSQSEVVHEAPSDYEFADEHGGTAAADEHTEEHSPLPSETKPAQRSPLLPVAAAVGGVLLLGTVAWWQLGSNSSSSQPVNDMSSMSIPGPSSTASGDTTAVTPAAALQVAPKTGASGSLAPASDSTTSSPSQQLAAAPPSAPSTSSPEVKLAAVSPSLSVSNSVSAGSTQRAASATTDSASDPKLEALAEHIDSLQKALDQANAQLEKMTSTLAASSAAATPSSKEMQDRLDKLEQQIAELRHTPPTLSAPAALSADTAGTSEMHAMPRVSHRAVYTHKAATHKTIKKKAPVEASMPVTHWILRAASPGQAWVSASATSTDLKELQVGDTLSGIGRVTAIQNQGDNWVVQGTNGKI